MANKYGLGRGLSSLFTVYEDEEPKEKKTKTVTKQPAQNEKTTIKQKSEPVIENDFLEDIPETVERQSYIEEKQSLSEKLSKLEKNYQKYDNDNLENDKVFEIPLKDIEPNTNQPRKNFDHDALMELAESIRAHGIIQPILVQRIGEKYVIIAGERRFKAARMVGLKTIPCIIKDYSTKERKEVALVENVQRQDLNPVETAFAIKKLVDDYNLTYEDVSEKIGKNVSVVSNYLRILRLEPEVLAMVEKGKLTFAHAKALVSITDRDTQIKLANRVFSQKISSRQLEVIVQNMINPGKVQKKKQALTLEMSNLLGEMQQAFGTKVSVIGTEKRGRIYLDYFLR